ncbi:MAG TPA: PQQ-binding-like beta-propeller repeat protein [Candidatus Limnocylindrales bacterium]|nr:PQQ-binding-like beta-propeller repeat protein [Candidatus Limnocylindrales bacterium]
MLCAGMFNIMLNCRSLAILCGAFVALRSSAAGSQEAHYWPQFRGPNCSGVALDAHPPVNIGPSNALLWSTEVPWSPSSPSIWGDYIFLTAFVDGELQTRCYDRRNGALIWSRGLKPDHLEVYHRSENSPASATSATDGHRVVSYFGSFGVICYDIKGKELWRHPLPVALSGGAYGSGTSPALFGDLVLINRDQDENSSLLALNRKTGKTLWETPRPDARGSFGTPIVWRNSGAEEVVDPGSLRLKAYDVKTGRETWTVEGLAGFACTTPVAGDGLLFFASWSPGKGDAPWSTWEDFLKQFGKEKQGEIKLDELPGNMGDFMRGLDVNHDGRITKVDWDQVQAWGAKAENRAIAVKPGGHGNISQTGLAWTFNRGLPYVASPLYYEGRLYLVRDGGMVSCFDAKTGNPFYLQERLEAIGSYYASPVAADGRIYFASLNGKVSVIKAGGTKPEILHQADFGDRILATPALVGNNLYLRTQHKLYAFGG